MANYGNSNQIRSLYASVLNCLGEMIVCINQNDEVIEINSAAENYYGWKKSDVLGKNFIRLCEENGFEYYPLIKDLKVIPQHNGQEFENSITLKSGKRHFSSWKAISLLDSKNQIIVFLIGHNTTGEIISKVAKKNIEKRLESVIESIAGNHWWKDINGRYMGFNGALAKQLGFNSASEILGKTDFDMPWVENASELVENDREVIESGGPKAREEKIKINDGRTLTFLVTKVPLKDWEGKIIGTIGTSFDITELKDIQLQLQIAKEKAEAANRAKTEFLEHMRHDIRTPLTGITGFASIIAEESRDPRIKEYADNLTASSYALVDLLNEILEVIKIGSHEIPLLKKKFNLKDKLLDVIKLTKARALQKNLQLTLD